MRELMARNSLEPDDFVSVILTCTDDLNAQFPAVGARAVGLAGCRLLCNREIDVPGAMERVIRVLAHYYAPARPAPRARLHRRDAGCAPTCTPPSSFVRYRCRSSSPASSRRSPATSPALPPARRRSRSPTRASPSSPRTSRRTGRTRRSPRRSRAPRRPRNRYPDPSAGLLRRRIAERFEVDPAEVAVANGSCEILLAAALALCEPGAELVYAWPSFSMYPYLAPLSGAREIRVPLDDGTRTTSTRSRPRSRRRPSSC